MLMTALAAAQPHQIRLTDPNYTPGLAELAEAIKEAGAKAATPINILRRAIDSYLSPGVQPFGPPSVSYIFDSSGGSTGLQTLRALSK